MDVTRLKEMEQLVRKLERIEEFVKQLEQCRILAESLQEVSFPDSVDPENIDEAEKELEPVVKMICDAAAFFKTGVVAKSAPAKKRK